MRPAVALLGLVCLAFLAGCGGSRDKDVNKGKDRPVPAEKK
jgi:hypothetical protein